MTDERREWAADRNRVIRERKIAEAETAERYADAARLADGEARRQALWDSARRTGEPVPSHNDILQRARDMTAEDERGGGTEYGSQSRPAVWWTAADGSPVEVTARPVAGVARSASETMDDGLLRQARESNSWMKVQIARSRARRRHEASRAGEAAVSRHGVRGGGYPEISR